MPASAGRLAYAAPLLALSLVLTPSATFARSLDLPIRDAAHLDVPAPAYLGDRLLVRLRPGAARATRPLTATRGGRTHIGLVALDATAQRLGAVLEPEFPAEPTPVDDARDLSSCWLVRLGPAAELTSALDAFAALPEVAEVSPVAICAVTALPNDSLFGVEWNLLQASRRDIHAPEAWNLSTGDPGVPIAILDTGIIPYHPDLGGADGSAGNLWINPAERDGIPGIDDDGNGYIDDLWGWDFIHLPSASYALAGEDWRDQDNDPNDFAGHGTAVASVVGAIGDNGIGLTGVLWHTQMMALRVGWASTSPGAALGEVDMAAAAQAIRYATRNGARVINCSFATVSQYDLELAVDEARRAGVTIVVAGGNLNSPQYVGYFPEIIAVAATDEADVSPSWSNRGSYVDLAAPGVNLFAAIVKRPGTDSVGVRQPGYTAGASGTSFAAPQVAAAAALLITQRQAQGLPPLSPYTIQMRLRETSDDISAVNTIPLYGDGRLNLQRALSEPPTSFGVHVPTTSAAAALVVRTERGAVKLLFPTQDARLVVVDPLVGDTLAGVPLPGVPAGAIAAADLGFGRGDGLFIPLADGRIASYDEHLAPRSGWPVAATRQALGNGGQLAVGDLDGDGGLEVVWGGGDGNVYAWRADGSRLPGFPRPVGAAGNSIGIALSDLDESPGLEILATLASGTVYALRADGSVLPGWPIQSWLGPMPPLVVRFGPSAPPRVVIAAGIHLGTWAADGSPVTSRSLVAPVASPPAAGDVNGDGVPELVVTEGSHVRVVDATLNLLPGTSLIDLQGTNSSEPLIGPLTAGGTVDLFLSLAGPTVEPFYAIYSPAGIALKFDKPGQPAAFPVLDDVDGDGRTEVLAGSGLDSTLIVFDLAATTWRPDRASWPTTRGNVARTGATTGAPAFPPFDDAAPLAVVDLAAGAIEAHGATLAWTAPRDSGGTGRAARYQVRWSRFALDEGTFASADSMVGTPPPDTAGAPQQCTVSGLDENTTYHVSLRSIDPRGNPSALSNDVSFTTAGAPPGSVRDLHVAAGNDTSVTLRWTAVGDDGTTGRPARYLVHAAREPLDDGNFDAAERAWSIDPRAAAGAAESRVLGGFPVGERWWFALRAEDARGNRSPLSNVVTALTGPLAARGGVALAAAANPARAPVTLYWQGAPEALGLDQRVRVYDLSGRVVRTIAVGRGAAGAAQWDGRDEQGASTPPGLYFARLESGSFHGLARIVLLR